MGTSPVAVSLIPFPTFCCPIHLLTGLLLKRSSFGGGWDIIFLNIFFPFLFQSDTFILSDLYHYGGHTVITSLGTRHPRTALGLPDHLLPPRSAREFLPATNAALHFLPAMPLTSSLGFRLAWSWSGLPVDSGSCSDLPGSQTP